MRTIPPYSHLLFLLLLSLLTTVSNAQILSDVEKNQLLDEISQKVKQHFYEKAFDTVAWKLRVKKCRSQLTTVTSLDSFDKVVNELLATLNASHTYFFSRNNPKRYQLLGVFHRLYDATDSSLFCYEGIGIDSRVVDGKVFVRSVFDGFPAAKAGLKFGDQFISVNGTPFHPIESFRGKANQDVTVEIMRADQPLTLRIPVSMLDGRTLFETALDTSIQVFERNDRKIGYVHLWCYAGYKYQEKLREAILWGPLSQSDALILDLRDGWGGADINYLNLFREPIARIKSTPREGVIGSYSGVWERPVALLTNAGSTSGKELFSYGFKKLQLGQIIGERTAGAVVAGRIFKLSSGDVLYLAVNDIHVDGKRLEGVGVAPDIFVPREMSAGEKDPQLEKALEVLGD